MSALTPHISALRAEALTLILEADRFEEAYQKERPSTKGDIFFTLEAQFRALANAKACAANVLESEEQAQIDRLQG